MALSTTTDTWDILDFVVKRGHGVKGLSEKDLEKVPNIYIQPLEERIDMKNVVVDESIPIIDVSNIENDIKIGDAICDAAEKWGSFQIINHGVPMEVIEKVMDGTRDFFALSAEEKNKYSKGKSLTNNVRYGTSFIPEVESTLEWKDYLSLLFTSQEEASMFWPQECRDQALNYLKWSEPIIKKLLEVLMRRLNVKEIDQTKSSLLTGSKRINLNYYPKCPNPELTVGVGRHSDVSTLTLLLQDDIGGLHVRTENNSWVHIPPVGGSLVVNVGDALQIISNGRYKSIEHRVVAHGSRNRVSVPIFVNPRPSDMIGPLPELIENGEKPIYKQVLYSDYVKQPSDMIGPLPELIENGEKPIYKQVLYSDYVKHFYRKAHDGKKTIDFAII